MKPYYTIARTIFETEIVELKKIQNRLEASFDQAIQAILNSEGKVVIMGVGKSGLIAQKIAATLTSTGTPTVFVHATEALHGDLGLISETDVVILISNTGTSPEIIALLPHLQKLGSKLIALTGNLNSELAQAAEIVLDIGVQAEACTVKTVPTSSTTATLVMGDALASTLAEIKQFNEQDFAEFHPGGGIGRRLKAKVRDLMHPRSELPTLGRNSLFDEIIDYLNQPLQSSQIHLGAALIVDSNDRLEGLITWGDIRMALKARERVFTMKAADIMKPKPITIGPEEPALEALKLMENREQPLSALPVVEGEYLVGFLKIQDVIGKV